MKRICVFCGSNSGNSAGYQVAAADLGRQLAERRIALVYGGSNVGLMGAVADSVLQAGGHAIGVIPRSLVDREVTHRGLPDLRVVETMHERKALMADLADGFVAMPGGYGTFDELCEILTWATRNPFEAGGIVEYAGVLGPIPAISRSRRRRGFLKPAHRQLIEVRPTANELLELLPTVKPLTAASK